MASLLSLIGIFAFLCALVTAQDLHVRATPSIYNESDIYDYHGCYNETTEVDGSAHTRALPDGINEVKKGEMTVSMCLTFCSEGDDEYRYAGLEWSR